MIPAALPVLAALRSPSRITVNCAKKHAGAVPLHLEITRPAERPGHESPNTLLRILVHSLFYVAIGYTTLLEPSFFPKRTVRQQLPLLGPPPRSDLCPDI